MFFQETLITSYSCQPRPAKKSSEYLRIVPGTFPTQLFSTIFQMDFSWFSVGFQFDFCWISIGLRFQLVFVFSCFSIGCYEHRCKTLFIECSWDYRNVLWTIVEGFEITSFRTFLNRYEKSDVMNIGAKHCLLNVPGTIIRYSGLFWRAPGWRNSEL